MKKNNLFFAFTFICLAIMVAVGSVLGVAAQVQPLAVQAASATTNLFDDNGNYAVSRANIIKGATFSFFGFDWKVVNVNYETNVATFWMVDPYTTHAFNIQTVSGDQNLLPNNLWRNGYNNSTVGGTELGESGIRAFLRSEATRLLDKDEYKSYRDKVLPGFQAGSNCDNNTAKKIITNSNKAITGDIKGADGNAITCGVYYANSGTTNFYKTDAGTGYTSMTADYSLDAADVWWLPATKEVADGGTWDLDASYRNWHNTAVSNLAWLRTADDDCNFRAYALAYNPALAQSSGGFKLVAVDRTTTSDNYTLGVRPAIHMDITTAGGTAVDGNNNGSNGSNKSGIAGWFTDDMMKVFFIIICVLGVIGIVLVVVAVVRKARERKQQGN